MAETTEPDLYDRVTPAERMTLRLDVAVPRSIWPRILTDYRQYIDKVGIRDAATDERISPEKEEEYWQAMGQDVPDALAGLVGEWLDKKLSSEYGCELSGRSGETQDYKGEILAAIRDLENVPLVDALTRSHFSEGNRIHFFATANTPTDLDLITRHREAIEAEVKGIFGDEYTFHVEEHPLDALARERNIPRDEFLIRWNRATKATAAG